MSAACWAHTRRSGFKPDAVPEPLFADKQKVRKVKQRLRSGFDMIRDMTFLMAADNPEIGTAVGEPSSSYCGDQFIDGSRAADGKRPPPDPVRRRIPGAQPNPGRAVVKADFREHSG